MKYRLPCERCGEKSVIDASLAGRQLVCGCGAALEVPSLREIRALEVASDVPDKPRPPSWNRSRGVVFAVGLVIAVLGLFTACAAGYGWFTAKVPPPPSPVLIEAELAAVDALSAPRAWDAWVDMRTNGLGTYMEPIQSLVEASLRRVFTVFVGGLVFLAAGIAAVAFSMLLPRKSRR
jgi:hypothetical protein